jgi:tetratricopeptide (TPR) repeat protein
MIKLIYLLRRKSRAWIGKIRRISLARWGLMVALVTGLITLVAWLWPTPLSPNHLAAAQPTTVAQSLGITEAIPPRKPGSVRILIARFDEANQSNYRVTELVLSKLKSALSAYPDTEVIAIGRVITEQDGSDVAISIGKTYNASIVIWGWYGLTERAVPLGIHFEIVETPDMPRPNSCASVTAKSRSQIRKATAVDLSDLTLQTDLSNELSYATIFTLGVSRYDAKDWRNAINMFDDALSHLDQKTILSAKTEGEGILIDQNILYYYRGKAKTEVNDFAGALDDFRKIPNPDLFLSFNIASALAHEGKIDEALEIYTQIVEKGSPDLAATAAYKRGFLYEENGSIDLANKDFNNVINTDQNMIPEYNSTLPTRDSIINDLSARIINNPNNPLYYYWRGTEYQKSDLDQEALNDMNKAITLNPEFHIAREARSFILGDLGRSQEQVDDLNYLFQAEEFRTPCNLQSRGISYQRLGNTQEAEQDLFEVISLTTKAIEDDPNNTFAYYVRGLAYNSLSCYCGQSFLKRLSTLSPFQFNSFYALRDKWKVRELDPVFAFRDGWADNTAIARGVLRVIAPYLFWPSLVFLFILCKEELQKFYPKIVKKIKHISHAHRP